MPRNLIRFFLDALHKYLCNNQLQGSLMLAGAIHFVVGATGLVGILLRFIGPVTIVPTILLIGIYMVTSVTKFAQVHWGISSMYVL